MNRTDAMRAGRILIVDDDPAIRNVLRSGLEAEGWDVAEAADRRGMIGCLETGLVDLITLDLALGADDGLMMARELRSRWNIPILMITGKANPIDRVTGLEHGADDYIVKPFHIREVILRIHNTLARYRDAVASERPPTGEGPSAAPEPGPLQRFGKVLGDLTGFERRLLELFARHPGRILTRDEISQALHGRDWSPYDRTIDGHIARLRRKLEIGSAAPSAIRSVRGVGYVLDGTLKSPPEAA